MTGVARRPGEGEGVKVERGPSREAGGGDHHSGSGALQRRQLAGQGPLRRHEAGVVRVEGEGAVGEQLALGQLPAAQVVEDRRGVDVQDGNREGLGRLGLAVAGGQRDGVGAGLEERGRPLEDAGVRVEERSAGQVGRAEGDRVSLGIDGEQRDADRVALADGPVGRPGDRQVDDVTGPQVAEVKEIQVAGSGDGPDGLPHGLVGAGPRRQHDSAGRAESAVLFRLRQKSTGHVHPKRVGGEGAGGGVGTGPDVVVAVASDGKVREGRPAAAEVAILRQDGVGGVAQLHVNGPVAAAALAGDGGPVAGPGRKPPVVQVPRRCQGPGCQSGKEVAAGRIVRQAERIGQQQRVVCLGFRDHGRHDPLFQLLQPRPERLPPEPAGPPVVLPADLHPPRRGQPTDEALHHDDRLLGGPCSELPGFLR